MPTMRNIPYLFHQACHSLLIYFGSSFIGRFSLPCEHKGSTSDSCRNSSWKSSWLDCAYVHLLCLCHSWCANLSDFDTPLPLYGLLCAMMLLLISSSKTLSKRGWFCDSSTRMSYYLPGWPYFGIQCLKWFFGFLPRGENFTVANREIFLY